MEVGRGEGGVNGGLYFLAVGSGVKGEGQADKGGGTYAKGRASVGSGRGHAGQGGAHPWGAAGEQTQSVEVESWDQVGLQLQGVGGNNEFKRDPRSSWSGYELVSSGVEENRRTSAAELAHVHGGHVALVRLPDLLHHFLLGQSAGLDGALHRDGPLRVVQSQVLQAGGGGKGGEVRTRLEIPAAAAAAPAPYGEMVILVPVSCSIFFRLRPSFPMTRPT